MQLSVGSETVFFKCYANLKRCSVKQLFNISKGESSLNCVVTSSLHPATAVSLLSKYSFPLFALMYEITTVMSVQQGTATALDVSPAATFPPWQRVSLKV